MKRIIETKILKSHAENMDDRINSYLREGWNFIPPISVVGGSGYLLHAVATLVKYDEEGL